MRPVRIDQISQTLMGYSVKLGLGNSGFDGETNQGKHNYAQHH